MRIPRKYGAGLLALLVALTLPVGVTGVKAEPALNPEPDVTVTIGSAKVITGESLTVPVKINAHKDVSSYNLQIDYNPEYLEIIGITPVHGLADEQLAFPDPQGFFISNIDATEGWIRTAWIDTTVGATPEHPIAGEEELFTIQAKSKGKVGTTALTVVESDSGKRLFTNSIFDSNGQPEQLTAQITEGTVAVSSPPYFSGNSNNVKVFVDGKEQPSYASAAQTTINGQAAAKIAVDNTKALALIEQNQLGKLTMVLPDTAQTKVVGGLNGKLVKAMESKKAEIELVTPFASYTLPAEQIRIDQIMKDFPADTTLEDIQIDMSMTQLKEKDAAAAVQAAVESAGGKLVANPVEFTVEASYGGKKVEVNQFNNYVERSISLPAATGDSRFTTAVVVQPDQSLSHVPTRIVQDNGQTKAVINSMTNSVYALVYSPSTFEDTASHWSKEEVTDLASRMVIAGVSDKEFAPDQEVTRAEFTAILLRAMGLRTPLGGSGLILSDVAASEWFAGNVATAVSYKLINGYEDGTFKPAAPITRAEAMTVMVRANKLLKSVDRPVDVDKVLAAFTDGQTVEGWAKESVAAAIDQGLVQGSDGRIKADDQLTRAESAALVRRMLVHAGLINP